MKLPLAILLPVILLTRFATAADDTFLDKLLPVQFFNYTSFHDWADKLHEYSGKTIVPPEGVAAFLAKNPGIDDLFKAGMESLSVGKKSPSLSGRDYLKRTALVWGITWKYDPKKDAIILGFKWEADTGSRSNAEFIKILLETKPMPVSYEDYQNHKIDPWRAAFDGLAGKPENKSIASITHWITGKMSDVFWDDEPMKNIFTDNILDEAGTQHLLIFNLDATGTIPGADYLSYYLFDRNGKIEEGGVLDGGGYTFGIPDGPRASLDEGKSHLTYHSRGTDLVFAVEKSKLVLKEKQVNGKPIEPLVFPDGSSMGKPIATLDRD